MLNFERIKNITADILEAFCEEEYEKMPLGRNVSKNISELKDDNKKKGNARGANGKARSHKQIVAIAMHSAGKGKKKY